MSEEFESLFEAPAECCGEDLDWIWDPDERKFTAECMCMRVYTLIPKTAIVESDVDEESDID